MHVRAGCTPHHRRCGPVGLGTKRSASPPGRADPSSCCRHPPPREIHRLGPAARPAGAVWATYRWPSGLSDLLGGSSVSIGSLVVLTVSVVRTVSVVPTISVERCVSLVRSSGRGEAAKLSASIIIRRTSDVSSSGDDVRLRRIVVVALAFLSAAPPVGPSSAAASPPNLWSSRACTSLGDSGRDSLLPFRGGVRGFFRCPTAAWAFPAGASETEPGGSWWLRPCLPYWECVLAGPFPWRACCRR